MTWVLPGATFIPLPSMSSGNRGPTLGVIVHVTTDDAGSPAHFFANAAHQASSMWFVGNGQGGTVDGAIEQYGDPDTQHAWAQAAGNWDYHSIEFEGTISEPMTPKQIAAGGHILAQGHLRWGWPLQIATVPGEPGLGVHNMGGAAWGGHSCPGPGPRQAQLPAIVAAAQAELNPTPTPTPATIQGDEEIMYLAKNANGPDMWVGNGITRSHIANAQTLKDMQYLWQKFGVTVHDLGAVANLDAIGAPVPTVP